MEQKVFIVGLGLIGSSLALAIKSKHPKVELSGFDLHETTVEIAVKKALLPKWLIILPKVHLMQILSF